MLLLLFIKVTNIKVPIYYLINFSILVILTKFNSILMQMKLKDFQNEKNKD